MARSFRINARRRDDRQMIVDSLEKSVRVISVGPFGGSVTRFLRSLRPDVAETAVPDAPASAELVPEETRVIILAASHPVPHFCDRIDKLSHERGLAFVPVILEPALLRVGPVVLSRRPPCWDCWTRRCGQFASSPNIHQALLQHYSMSNRGPRGHLASFAAMAAGRVASVLSAMEAKPQPVAMCSAAGRVWQIDLLTRTITAGRAEGIHDCPRCGLHRPAAARSFLEMQAELGYLWEHGAGGDKKETA